MSAESQVAGEGRSGEVSRSDIAREAVTMVLYVSIVLLATLTALPAGEGDGVHGATLVAVVWGTALGLALAHWFAFRLAARLFGRGDVGAVDVEIGLAQVGGAVVVAALCTIPIVLAGDESEVEVTTVVPALIVGAAGYAIARVSGRTVRSSLVVGLVVLVMGLLVAAVKNVLAWH